MPWISVDSKLPSHRKLRILRKRLGISLHEAIGVLVTIWLWALEDADRDGLIVTANAKDMAEAIRWKADPEQLLGALAEAQLVHNGEKGILIHDWPEHQGPWEAYKNRQRLQREYSRKKRACKDDDRSDSLSHIRIDGRTNNDTLPNHTKTYESRILSDGLRNAIFGWLGGLPPAALEDIAYFIGERGCDEELVLEAVAEARGRGVRAWEYARAIIRTAIDDGLFTGSEFRVKKQARKAKKEEHDGKRTGPYCEGGYDWNKLA